MEAVGYKIDKSKMETVGLLLKALPDRWKFKKTDTVDLISLERDQIVYIICLANTTYILCPETITKHIPEECIPVDDLTEMSLDALRGSSTELKSDLQTMVEELSPFMEQEDIINDMKDQTEYMKIEDKIEVVELRRKDECQSAAADVNEKPTTK